MATVINEYPIPTGSVFELVLPPGSKFLSAGIERGVPKMWFAGPTAYPELHGRRFTIRVTGDYLPEDIRCEHLATIVGATGTAHLFEVL